jgi:hypothetical protein
MDRASGAVWPRNWAHSVGVKRNVGDPEALPVVPSISRSRERAYTGLHPTLTCSIVFLRPIQNHLTPLLLSPSGLFIFRNTQTDKATSSAVPVFLRRSPIRRYRFVLESLSCREISFTELPCARFCSTMDSSTLNCGSGSCIAHSVFLKGAAQSLPKLKANRFDLRSGSPNTPSSDFLISRVLMTDPSCTASRGPSEVAFMGGTTRIF